MTSLHRIYKSQYAINETNTVKLQDDLIIEPKHDVRVEMPIKEEKEDTKQVTLMQHLELEAEKKNVENMKIEASLIVERAKEQAKRILEDARTDGARIKQEIIDEGVKHVKEVQEQGYREGFMAKEQEILELVKYMNEVLKQTQKDLRQNDHDFITKLEADVRLFALEIAEKILSKEIETDQLALSCLTFELLDSIKKDEKITIEVSNKAKDLIRMLENEFSTNSKYSSRQIDIKAINADEGTLHINREGGTSIDASVDVQLKKLREIFEKF